MTEVKELSFDEILKLITTNKATPVQKMRFAKLLEESTQKELEAEKEQKFEKIKELMEKLEITAEDMIKALQKPAAKIFEWEGHVRFEGERGKLPVWCNEMKSKLPQAEALTFALTEKGKVFVENLYKK